MTRRLATWSAILACVGIVLWPFFSGAALFSPAHWHLAAAANSLKFDDGRFDEHLSKARLANEDLESLYDYWLLRVQVCFETRDEQALPEVIAQAKASKIAPTLVNNLALSASGRLQVESQFLLAVDVLEVISKNHRNSPLVLNQLAYLRSLAGDELDIALEDIEHALEKQPDEDAFRDTRAWVLFQMGRPIEALEDAEFAVKKAAARRDPTSTMLNALIEATIDVFFGDSESPDESDESPMESDESFDASEETRDVETDPNDVGTENTLTQSEVTAQVWNEAVLRYHRLRILESLGREEEAEADRNWIRSKDLPVDDRLH